MSYTKLGKIVGADSNNLKGGLESRDATLEFCLK